MRRVLGVSVAAALATLGVALAAEKGGPVFLIIEEEGGALTQGKAHLRKDAVEVEAPAGPKKIPYRRVTSIEEVDPESAPPEGERPVDRADFESRAKAIEDKAAKEKDDRRDGSAWSKLGVWAKRKGLDPEARKAFEKAIALLPDDWDARHGMGQAKSDEGEWEDVNKVWAKKRQAVPRTAPFPALYELGHWAAKNGLDDEAIDVVFPITQKDAYDKAALSYLRPITDRRKSQTRLAFPVHGKWRASQDPSHHHERKAFAVYAVDLYGEVEGRPWKGDGKNLEDHYAWGQPIYACADGQVVDVREGFPDNPVGQADGKFEKHNGVYILHQNNEASWYFHTQKGSITVKKNDHVKRGDLIARVGNSGGSTQPHLHFTLVDAIHAISVPWRCDDYVLITDDGTRVKVKRGRPVEGQLIDAGGAPEPQPR